MSPHEMLSNIRARSVSIACLLTLLPLSLLHGAAPWSGKAAALVVPATDAPSGRVAQVGDILRTGPAGQNAGAMVVNTQASRVFVVNIVTNGICPEDNASPTPTGTVDVLDSVTGSLLRTVSIGLCPQKAALDVQSNRLFITNAGVTDQQRAGTGRGTVSVLDATTSAVLRTVRVGIWPYALAVDARAGRVYVTNRGESSLSVLDATTGAVLQTITMAPCPWAIAVAEQTGRAFIATCGTPRDDYVGDVWTLDTRHGTMVRTVPRAASQSVVVAARTRRVFVSGFNKVYVLDAATGALLHSTRVVGDVKAVDERVGHAFMAQDDDRLTMLDATSGSVLSSIHIARGIAAVAVDEQRGHAFVSTVGYPNGNTVSVVDTHSGAVLHTVPVGPYPALGAVDSRAGHVFVISKDNTNPTGHPHPILYMLDAGSGGAVGGTP